LDLFGGAGTTTLAAMALDLDSIYDNLARMPLISIRDEWR